MHLRSRPKLRALTTIVALLALPGCGFGLARKGPPPTPKSTIKVSYGDGIDLEAPGGKKRTAVGTLAIKVFDDSGRPLPGAYVRYKGVKKGKVKTDAKGAISVNLPAGRYLIDLPPCGATVMPQSPGEVDVVVVAGQTAKGSIVEIPWKRRYYPTASVKVYDKPPWKRGESVRLGVRIEDGCTFSEAGGASVSAYRWRASSNFGFLGYPSRAGRNGYADVVVRCKSGGNGSIVIYDPLKDVRVDLLESASQPSGSWCA